MNEIKIMNCTPHEIVYHEEHDGFVEVTSFPPSGIVPRVETIEYEAEPVNGFKCVTQSSFQVSGLPEYQEDTFLIVSAIAFAASDRKDIIAPDTGKCAKRNDKGQIVAVTRFIRKGL